VLERELAHMSIYPSPVDPRERDEFCGCIPFFPRQERRVDLELVENRSFSSRVVYLRYRVAR